MLTYYHLEEALQNIRQHKLRSALTGLGVMWGVMILVILLGVGEGFYTGVLRRFGQYAQNSMYIWAGQRADGERIAFNASLLKKIPHAVAGIKGASPVVGQWQAAHIAYQRESYQHGETKGVSASYDEIAQLSLAQGRFLNPRDEQQMRPVCVIGEQLKRSLFKDKDPIGTFISINGHYFQVVGTLSRNTLNKEERKTALIPYTTFCKTFNWGVKFFDFRLMLQKDVVAQRVEDNLRAYLGKQLHFDHKQERTLWIFSQAKRVQDFENLFRNIRIFLWVISICTLLGGIVGVSNMMLVAVKERTQEIGIRKVLGASSREILTMILIEAIGLSLIAGIVGMLVGQGVIHCANLALDTLDPAQQLIIAHLAFKPYAAVASLVLLVATGAIAGIIPARRATAIRPIKALNTE